MHSSSKRTDKLKFVTPWRNCPTVQHVKCLKEQHNLYHSIIPLILKERLVKIWKTWARAKTVIQRNHYCTVTEPCKKRSAALARSLRGAWIFVELVLIKSSRETLAVKISQRITRRNKPKQTNFYCCLQGNYLTDTSASVVSKQVLFQNPDSKTITGKR